MTKTKKLKMILFAILCALIVITFVLGSILQGHAAFILLLTTIVYFAVIFCMSPSLDDKIKKEIDARTEAMNELLKQKPE